MQGTPGRKQHARRPSRRPPPGALSHWASTQPPGRHARQDEVLKGVVALAKAATDDPTSGGGGPPIPKAAGVSPSAGGRVGGRAGGGRRAAGARPPAAGVRLCWSRVPRAHDPEALTLSPTPSPHPLQIWSPLISASHLHVLDAFRKETKLPRSDPTKLGLVPQLACFSPPGGWDKLQGQANEHYLMKCTFVDGDGSSELSLLMSNKNNKGVRDVRGGGGKHGAREGAGRSGAPSRLSA